MGRKWKSSEESRLKIMQGATTVFVEKGFYGAGIRDISEACGLSLPSLYHHFANKEALFTGALTHVQGQLTQAIDAGLVRDQDIRAEIHSIFQSIKNFQEANPDYILFIFNLAYAAPRNIQEKYSVEDGPRLRGFIKSAFRRHKVPREGRRIKLNLAIAIMNNFLLDLTVPRPSNRKLLQLTLESLDSIL